MAIRIKKRGGAGGVLNSKAEFNRCYIPRMVVEEEEESSKKDRLVREQAEREEMHKALEHMDESWEQRKSCERELAVKKRGRINYNVIEGEKKPMRSRKMQYPVIEENWGEKEEEYKSGGEEERQEEEQRDGNLHSSGRRTDKYLSTTVLTPSHISDYFAPLNKKSMEQ